MYDKITQNYFLIAGLVPLHGSKLYQIGVNCK